MSIEDFGGRSRKKKSKTTSSDTPGRLLIKWIAFFVLIALFIALIYKIGKMVMSGNTSFPTNLMGSTQKSVSGKADASALPKGPQYGGAANADTIYQLA